MDFNLITNILQSSVFRDHSFFSNPNKYKPFSSDSKNFNSAKVHDLTLEVVGYGQFHPEEVVKRYLEYFRECVRQFPALKSLKIKINGFNLQKNPELISETRNIVKAIKKNQLAIFEISMTRLTGCDMSRDFEPVFRMCLEMGLKPRANFSTKYELETMVMQFADWEFERQGKHIQPSPAQLRDVLSLIEEESMNSDGYCFRTFRLQLSTWYYEEVDATVFFSSKEMTVGQFHEEISRFVQSCYDNMPDLHSYDLDLRNWHAKFQMKDLRKILNQIKKDGANHMSINSKNISRVNKKGKKEQNDKQKNQNALFKEEEEEDEEALDFAPHFMM